MVVYLDLVILFTLLVNYALIKTIFVVFKEKEHIWYLITGLFLATASFFLYFLPIKWLYQLRYFIGIIIGEITFRKCHYRKKIVMIMSYYLLNLTFIGALVVFNITSYWLLVVALIYIVVLYLFEKKYQIDILQVSITYNVKIKGIKKQLIGRSDSGNESYYQGIPVVFIKKKYCNEYFKKVAVMAVTTISGANMVEIYEGDDLVINNIHYLVYYSFIDLHEYDLILHKDMGVFEK